MSKGKPKDEQATRQTRFGVNLYGFCTQCGDAKTENRCRLCRGCFHGSRRGKAFGEPADEGGSLRLKRLSPEQREVFDAIMRNHKWTAETRNEALGMIALAEARGELAQELEFWTARPDAGETRRVSSLALMSAYAPGAIV